MRAPRGMGAGEGGGRGREGGVVVWEQGAVAQRFRMVLRGRILKLRHFHSLLADKNDVL